MKTASSDCIQLAPGHALRLDHAQGRELIVTQGRIWLTCRGDHSEDSFLTAGHGLRLGAGAVIECDGTEAACVRLLPAPRPWTAAAARVLSALVFFASDLARLHGLQPAPFNGR
jgi:hypothetical protein